MEYKKKVAKEEILDVKGLDKALMGHPAIQALHVVRCVQSEERLRREHTVIIY